MSGKPLPAVVWKYSLAGERTAVLEMPRESIPLAVGVQRGVYVLWAIGDPDAPRELRRFRVCTTGQRFEVPAGHELRYIGTVQEQSGPDFHVEHVFELTRQTPERWAPLEEPK